MHSGKPKASRKSIEALAAELQSNGLDTLAADVTFGPIAVAARMLEHKASSKNAHGKDSDSSDSAEDCIDDILDESDSEDDLGDENDDEDDSFDEVLDEDEDEDASVEGAESSNQISSVILDPGRIYSKQELQTLRMVANTCIERHHHIPNAKALLRSLDAYESQH